MKKFEVLFFAAALISGCENQNSPQLIQLTEKNIHTTVERALNGIKSASDSLSGLIDSSFTYNKKYKLIIDTINMPSGRFFSVLVEYPNSIYNRFGIYDDSLKCLLIDKSLNGAVSERTLVINNYKYININEAFVVQDTFSVNRLSLYKVEKDKAYLVFRIFTRLKDIDGDDTQIIEQFSQEQIFTKIESTNKNLTAANDIFKFDSLSNSYISSDNFFNNFVLDKIQSLPGDKAKLNKQ